MAMLVNMGSQFSFFNLAGYLFPGIIFLALLSWPLGRIEFIQKNIIVFYENISKVDSFPAVIALTTAFALPILAIIFFFGILVSESYTFVMTKLFFSEWNSDEFKPDSLYAKLEEKGVDAVLGENWGVREALVLGSIGSSHLYEFAGRSRLLGASGFALVVAGIIYLSFSLTCLEYFWSGIISCVFGVLVMCLAYSRHKIYNEFIDINTFVFYRILKKTNESSTSINGDSASKNS